MGFLQQTYSGAKSLYSKFNTLLAEMENFHEVVPNESQPLATTPPVQERYDLEELSFTRSLLALSRVRSLCVDGYQAPASAESSSLVSVPLAQSKNPDSAL